MFRFYALLIRVHDLKIDDIDRIKIEPLCLFAEIQMSP